MAPDRLYDLEALLAGSFEAFYTIMKACVLGGLDSVLNVLFLTDMD